MSVARRWVRSVGRLALSASARDDARHELTRRLRGEPALPDGALRHVLVLCHGNICRSPFAAAVLATRVPELVVRSAGLHAGEGDPADAQAARCAERFGVSLAAHRSTRVSDELLAWAHLVLVMEGSQKAAVDRGWPQTRGRVRLLGDFLATPPHRLRDPWGQPEAVFDEVFERLGNAVDRLAIRLESSAAGLRAR